MRVNRLPRHSARRLFFGRRPTSINLGFGDPGLTDPELVTAGYERFQRSPMSYAPSAGIPELRQQIADYHGFPHARGPDNVLVTAGGSAAMTMVFMTIGEPGDEILICEPEYWNYRVTPELLELQVRSADKRRDRGFALDPDAIRAAITPRTRAIAITTPGNPTGVAMSRQELEAVVEATRGTDIWLISDEIYRDLYYGDEPPVSLGSLSERAIVISGFSKNASLAGFRVCHVVAPDAIAEQLVRIHQHTMSCAPAFSQYLALEALEDLSWIERNRQRLAARREVLLEELKQHVDLPFAGAEGGLYLMLDARSYTQDTLRFCERMLEEADVVVVPGRLFGEAGEGFLRLCFTEPPDAIREGVRRLAWFLDQQRG